MSVDDVPDPIAAPARIAEIARHLYRSRRPDRLVVVELAEHAASELPGVDYANVTVTTGPSMIEPPSATHPSAALLDDIQRRLGEGPCLSSAWHNKTVHVEDLENDTRWPSFRAEALSSTPVRSIMGFHLCVTGRSMGSLNVFAERPRAFDEQTRRLGSLFAVHSALVWDAARREAQFQEALASRDTIGQAKGMIMERYRLDAAQAFAMLRTLSHETNTALADVAARIVEAAQSDSR